LETRPFNNDLSTSRDINDRVTFKFTIVHVLLVVHWNRSSIYLTVFEIFACIYILVTILIF